MQREYIDLNTIFKSELKSKTYTINEIVLTENQVRMEEIRNMRQYWLVDGLKSDFKYIRLIHEDGIMMSDTPMERNTNEKFLRNANGDVLIFGLGLGLIVFPLLKDDTIKSITIVELYQDLIDLINPIIKEHDKNEKVKIIQGDCFNFSFPKDKKFDTIYFDIWISICQDNYEEQKLLFKKFRPNLNKNNPNKYMDAWMMDYYKKQSRKNY